MTNRRWIVTAAAVAMVLGAAGSALAGAATASANPPSAPINAMVTLSGSGWLPGETIEIFFGGDLQYVTTDSNGDFSAPWTVPAFMPVGSHPLEFDGDMGSSFTTSFEVTNPPPTTTTTAATTTTTAATTTTTAAPPTTQSTTTTSAATSTTVAPTTTARPATTVAPVVDDGGDSPVLWVLLGALLATVIGGAFLMGRSTRRVD